MYTSGSRLVYVARLHGIAIPDYGKDVQVRCPFHKLGRESTPSARFYPDTDSLYCFACNRSWSPLQLESELAGTTLRDAAETLKAHGIKINLRTAILKEDPKKELDELIVVASLRFRAKPDSPAKRKMFDVFDKLQALVLTGQGDAREAVTVIRSQIGSYEQSLSAA